MLIYIGVSVVVLVTCLGCVTQLQRTEHFLSLFQRMKAYLTLVWRDLAFLIMMGRVMHLDRLSLLTAFFERYSVGGDKWRIGVQGNVGYEALRA